MIVTHVLHGDANLQCDCIVVFWTLNLGSNFDLELLLFIIIIILFVISLFTQEFFAILTFQKKKLLS